jgi:hypothetical protein
VTETPRLPITNTQIEKPNCKINLDCYGSISVEAPTVPEAKELFQCALDVKQNKPLQKAII